MSRTLDERKQMNANQHRRMCPKALNKCVESTTFEDLDRMLQFSKQFLSQVVHFRYNTKN